MQISHGNEWGYFVDVNTPRHQKKIKEEIDAIPIVMEPLPPMKKTRHVYHLNRIEYGEVKSTNGNEQKCIRMHEVRFNTTWEMENREKKIK